MLLEKFFYLLLVIVIGCLGVLVVSAINLLAEYAATFALWLLAIIVLCIVIMVLILATTKAFDTSKD